MYPQRRADVRSTLLPDGYLVLFSTKTEWAQTLNPTAAIVWEFCDGERTVAEIAEELTELLGEAVKGDITKDVSQTVCDLVEAGLLIVEPKE
jgi:hypothetical protein